MDGNLKDVYLSIDLDYWDEVTSTTLSFLKQVLQLNVPKILCKSHEQMLRNVNNSKCRVLMNVDYHADLCEDDEDGSPPTIECGTWVNAVKWRSKGTFIWVCPNRKKCYENGEGRCDTYRDSKTDPFKKHNNGWKKTSVKTGLKHVNLNRIGAVGIAVSPDYLQWNILDKERNTSFLKVNSILSRLPFVWLTNLHKYEPVKQL